MTIQKHISIEEQATQWFVRLRDANVSDADHLEFEKWYHKNPEHQVAYNEMLDLWSALPNIQEENERPAPDVAGENVLDLNDILTASSNRPKRIYSIKKWAIAASILFMAAISYVISEQAVLFADLKTKAGEHISYEMTDGSTVFLNTDSAVSFTLNDNKRIVRLHKGEAFFDVETDPARPFFVETDSGTIKVLGTAFSVKHINNTLKVVVTESKVQLTTESGKSAQINEGQAIEVVKHEMGTVHSSNPLTDVAWRKGRLVFENEPLSHVIDELSRYTDQHMMIMNDAIKNIPVTGSFPIENIDIVLKDFEQTLPVSVFTLSDFIAFIGPSNN